MKGRSHQPRVTVSYAPEALAKERTAVRNGKAGALRALLDEMDRKVGKPSASDQAWARSVLGI